MSRMRLWFVAGSLVIGTAIVGGQSSAAALFQQGLMLERAEGNVDQAIVLFERVVAEFPNDSAIVPQAMVHLARVYDTRQDPRALRMWSRLATEYPASPYAVEAKGKVAAGQSQATGPFRIQPLDGVFGSFAGRNSDSPDGRTIAWIRSGDSDDVMIRAIDTGKDRLLLKLPGRLVMSLRWSEDSSRIALITRAVGSSLGPDGVAHDVRLVTIQSVQVKTVATAGTGTTTLFWSPDSRTLLMHVGGEPTEISTDLRLVDAITGESRKVALASQMVGEASWSQDGKQVALRTVTPPNQDVIWTLTVSSGQLRELKTSLNNGEGRINVATGVTKLWTADGRILVRQQRMGPGPRSVNAFYWISSTTGQATLNCAQGQDMRCLGAMTPNGTRLALDASTNRILLIDPLTAAIRRATTGSADESEPFLSPDGRLLLFISNPDGVRSLYVVPVDQTPVANPVRISTLEAAVSPILYSWRADGHVVINYYQEDTDVFRINMDRNGQSTGAPLRLTQDTHNNFRPAVSPDARTIAYQFDRGIAVMAADGASERPVVTVNARGRVEWRSSDEVIFQRGDLPQTSSLASLNIKTGSIQPLVDLPFVGDRWQYDLSRNAIVYLPTPESGVSSIHARSLADGSDRVLATLENKNNGMVLFCMSPDGRSIAWDRLVGPPDRRLHEMHVMTADGKNDHLLKIDSEPVGNWQSSGPYAFSPDGRFLMFDGRPGKLMVADVSSGQSWPIAGAADTDVLTWSQANWSPDGTFVVLSRNGWRDDFRMIEALTYDAVVRLSKGK